MGIDNVIFLGAGASAPEGAPLQGELFREYFRYQRDNPIKSRRSMDRRLSEFFDVFFGIDVANDDLDVVDFPTFEEAIGMIDLAIQKMEGFKCYRSDPIGGIIHMAVDLVFLIAVILDQKLGAECRYHVELVRGLENRGQLENTCFVDLNYDILMDNALLKLAPSVGIDYGVAFANAEALPDCEKRVPLCKLHGSLNWLYCPTCVALSLTPGTGGAGKLIFAAERCATCGTVIFPILIPPSFFKAMNEPYIKPVWGSAEAALLQARRLFFCGYSFPDADIHLKYMLKRAEVNGTVTPEIAVINNFEGKPQEQKDTEFSRYARFFRDSGRLDFREQTFEQFCAEGIVD